MEFVLDTHTHTMESGHAYFSLEEMARAASLKGLELLGITEHAPKMPGTCHELHFHNFRVLERKMFGVELLMGAELNILDFDGHVDLPVRQLKKMDLVIASLHTPCICMGTEEENTRALLRAMENPLIDIIGHPDDGRYPLNYRELVYGAKEHGKLLEVNNTSLSPGSVRQGARENYFRMLEYCREYRVCVVAGSDAHAARQVGGLDQVKQLLLEARFPEELVVNLSVAALKEHLHKFSGQQE